MGIAHIAIWTTRLEELREFYCEYFGGTTGHKYVNPSKGFESYFVDFGGGTQLELMRRADITEAADKQYTGPAHMAFSFDERDEVVSLTELLRSDGYRISGEPRVTGDGFFESAVLDPDGNIVELVSD